VYVWVFLIYSVILFVFYRRLKNNLDAMYHSHKWIYAVQALGMMTFIVLKIILDFLLYHFRGNMEGMHNRGFSIEFMVFFV